MNELQEYYEKIYTEHTRLFKSKAHSIEYLTTIHFLDKYLQPKSRILDACAGTGAYAFYLAEKGHAVTACDLVQKHVDTMKADTRTEKLADIQICNALYMPAFEDDSFDVVLCMGALYHLMNADDRRKCVAECLRVLKPGGIVAFAYLNRNGMYVADLALSRGDSQSRAQILKTGRNSMFYGMNFGEVDELFGGFSLEKITNIGVNTLAYSHQAQINDFCDEDFSAFMRYHLATCQQPSIIDHGAHGLWIGKKE